MIFVSKVKPSNVSMVKKVGSPGGQDSLSNQSKKRRGKWEGTREAPIQIEVNAGKQGSRTDSVTLPEFVRKLIVLHRGSAAQELNPESEFTVIILSSGQTTAIYTTKIGPVYSAIRGFTSRIQDQSAWSRNPVSAPVYTINQCTQERYANPRKGRTTEQDFSCEALDVRLRPRLRHREP